MIDLRAALPVHPTLRWGARSRPIDTVAIHHSATPASTTPEAMARYHISRDYPGIAYHYVVEAGGTVYWCNDASRLTWHGNGANSTGVGVCLVGDFTAAAPPSAQLLAARGLVVELEREHGPLDIIGHREAAGASTACPGATWELWRGTIEARGDMASKLSFQVQNCGPLADPNHWVSLHIRESGARSIMLIDPDVLRAHPCPGVRVMGRLWFAGEPDRAMIARGAAGAHEYVALCSERWASAPWVDIWHGPNEPYTGNPEVAADLDAMRELAAFYVELARLMHARGLKIGVGVFSTGTPAGPRANPLPAIAAKWRAFGPACAVADALVVHEYGMDTLRHTDENLWHVGHYRRGTRELRAAGYRVPPIWVTEHGIDRAGGPTTDGWRVKLNGDEAEYMRQLALRDAEYGADPDVEVVTPFVWLDYGWPSFSINESMSGRIVEHIKVAGGGGVDIERLREHKIRINRKSALWRAIRAAGQFPAGQEFTDAGEVYQWAIRESTGMWHLWRWMGGDSCQSVMSESIRD